MWKILSDPNFVKTLNETSITGLSLHLHPKVNIPLDSSKSNLKAIDDWSLQQMIGLCRKSYCTELFATENSPTQVKFSMKGVNKGQFKNPMPHYKHVLNTKQNFRACNQGIRAKDESMVTYKQDKNALTYFYPKRKVLADGRTTVPLDI